MSQRRDFTIGLFWKAIVAVLLLPGIVAFIIPLYIFALRAPDRSFDALGVPPIIFGVSLLFWCVRDFYVTGHGTLAPWAPPHDLVVVGPYRFSRNPMYLAVLSVLLGWTVGFHSWVLAGYALAVAVFFYLEVVMREERWLARTYGEKWTLYKRQVPRWLGFHKPTSEELRPSN